ncbi:MAG: hypothetical protein ACR2L6_03595 [Gemmatimonadaceae bacterium]
MTSRFAFLAAFLAVTAADVRAQTSRDALDVDPRHHQVLFENDYVRVFRALAGGGARSPMHTHPHRVLVSLGTTRLRMTLPNGTNPVWDFMPGQVAWMPADEHAWELVAGAVHVIGVEIKRPAPASFAPLPATDAVTADPEHHQVVLDNDHVRVMSGLASEGARSPMHSHSMNMVIVSLGRVRLRLAAQDAPAPVIIDLTPGQVMWFDPGAHSWEILAGQHNAFAVEVKASRR